MSSSYETIELDVADTHVATITLNRPDRLNAFTETMANEVADVWGRVRDDDTVHSVVLRANGDRAFCTGIDVKEGAWWIDRNIWNHEDPGAHLGPVTTRCGSP